MTTGGNYIEIKNKDCSKCIKYDSDYGVCSVPEEERKFLCPYMDEINDEHKPKYVNKPRYTERGGKNG